MDRDELSIPNTASGQQIQNNAPVQGLNIAHEQRIEQHFHVLASAPTAPPAPLWTVPLLRNPHFSGRDDLLAQLEERLAPPAPHDNGQPTPRRAVLTQPQAITGLGGIGKTQLAVEYAYRSREQGRYTHTLWINAASEEAIITSFATLATDVLPVSVVQSETDQRKIVAAIRRWLERCEQSWLLIFDNADDPLAVVPYLPRVGNGSILLTTRDQTAGALAFPLSVENMGLMEGVELLLKRAQRDKEAADEEINDAINVVIALDYFPLALDQAGAYIEETGCGFTDYLQLYSAQRKKLLARRGKQASNYPDSVATTWALSFAKVEQASPAAADLLQLCAFLAPDQIPEELIREGTAHWPAALREAASDPLTFNDMIAELLKYSLVARLPESQALRLHRLVQAVQIDAMKLEMQRQWAERVVLALDALFPQNPEDVNTWSRCQRLLAQAQACYTLISQLTLVGIEAADLLYRTGLYLVARASYTLAEPLYQRALSIREQQLGPEHPDIATSLNNLAELYRRQGKYEQAEPLYQRALAIRERHLGPEHPDTAQSLNNLAILYRRQGKYEQAEPLLVRALSIREQQLGSEHPETAASLDNLASLYKEQGRYEQAAPLYQRALAIYEKVLGLEHPRTQLAGDNYTKLLQAMGRDVEAGQAEEDSPSS